MTPPMTPPQWERVQQVFADALSVPADERDALIAARLADDATLAAEVRRMLAAHDATGPLDRLADWVDAGAAGPGHSTVDQEAGASPVRIGVWRIASLLGRGGWRPTTCRADVGSSAAAAHCAVHTLSASCRTLDVAASETAAHCAAAGRLAPSRESRVYSRG
jgi:hypothetical protein